MFEGIKNFFRDIRIDLDFPKYERLCRYKHEQQAQRRFSTKQLDDEIKKLLATIESQACAKYNDLIVNKEAEKKRREINAAEIESMLSYFVRSYKQELDELYANNDAAVTKKSMLYEMKNELSKSLLEAFAERDNAYSELNYYKDQIDSWYTNLIDLLGYSGMRGKNCQSTPCLGKVWGILNPTNPIETRLMMM